MNAFVRQLAVLSVLWALCELLLPGGRQRPLVRMTISVLVIAALLSTAGQWLASMTVPALPTLADQAAQTWKGSYRNTALTAAANQVKGYCERLARRAGYEASATVFLTTEGALERVELTVRPQTPLMELRALRGALAQRLGVEETRLVVNGAEGT